MNSLGVFFFACAVAIAVSGVRGANLDDCPLVCPYIYWPTCAKGDGNHYEQYSNACQLKAFNCERQKSALPTYDEVHLDFCKTTELTEGLGIFTKDLQEIDASCMKPCNLIYRPVCGSNGSFRATFSNECEMELYDCVHKHQNKNGWNVIKSRKCSENLKQKLI